MGTIGKQIDAVFIATPNHHHTPAAMLAMQLGKAVYCEKPLTHDIAEAFQLNAEVIKIADGKVVQQGPVAEVLAEERTRLLQQLHV